MATKDVSEREPYKLHDDGTPKMRQVAKLLHSADFLSASASEFDVRRGLIADVPIDEMAAQVRASIEQVQGGDMSGMEAMLVGQAHALQNVFASLMRRASTQQQLKQYQTFMNLGLKAQAQSRATIQALTELKYPRQVVIAKQANIANGHQQVNNAAPAPEIAAAQTEILEAQTYGSIGPQRLDTRTTRTAGGIDKELATVGEGNRPKNARRQSRVKDEQL